MLIQHGTIIDGTKAKRQAADVRIVGEKITEIGSLTPRRGEEVIQARGKFVTPGFIGFFEHKDLRPSIFSHTTQERAVREGITSMLVGLGGTSLAPLVEPDVAPHIQTNINWRTVEEYLTNLSMQQPICNIGTFIGYDTVRHVGTTDEIHQVIAGGLAQGAFGVSFATVGGEYLVERAMRGGSALMYVGRSISVPYPLFLQRNVREKKLLSWEEAIHRITLEEAEAAKITNRGKLAEGYFADIVVFDPMHISSTKGVSRVLVNGGARGAVLKHF